jgi:hypothetical protein
MIPLAASRFWTFATTLGREDLLFGTVANGMGVVFQRLKDESHVFPFTATPAALGRFEVLGVTVHDTKSFIKKLVDVGEWQRMFFLEWSLSGQFSFVSVEGDTITPSIEICHLRISVACELNVASELDSIELPNSFNQIICMRISV